VTRPRQRLTATPCVVCGKTTRNWSRTCNTCTKAERPAPTLPEQPAPLTIDEARRLLGLEPRGRGEESW
jgi:hypothetical protein